MRNERLEALMAENMVKRAQGGPNSNPPASQRSVPRVSMLSSGCARQSYFYLVGAQEIPMDAMGAASTQAGQALEADVLADVKAALGADDWQEQVRVESNLWRGTADLWSPSLKIVVDAKTCNAAAFDIISKQGAKEDHVRQLNAYASSLGAERILIAYRGTGNTKKINGGAVYLVYEMAPDPSALAQMEQTARAALAGRETGQAPPRAYAQSHWLCASYCPHRVECWS